jgi:tetratricopeptide (TPR) repeat protein
MNSSVDQRMNRCLDREDWAGARRLIRAKLLREPESHWLLTRLGLTYYEERRYREALTPQKKALTLAPRCPLVRWDYAGTIDALGRRTEAIAIWRTLLRQGERRIAHGPCGEGLRWTRSLLNDCRYRLALACRALGRLRSARHYLAQHLRRRRQGVPSIYPLSLVRRRLAGIWPRATARTSAPHRRSRVPRSKSRRSAESA